MHLPTSFLDGRPREEDERDEHTDAHPKGRYGKRRKGEKDRGLDQWRIQGLDNKYGDAHIFDE